MPRMPFAPPVPGQTVRQSGTRWVLPGWNSDGTATKAIASGLLIFQPFYVAQAWTYIGIGISVSTLGVGSARMGVYSWGSANYPSSLILDAGTVNVGSNGDKVIVISLLLGPGYYFLATVVDVAVTLWAIAAVVAGGSPVSGVGSTPATNYSSLLSLAAQGAQVAGGLSNPATAGATRSTREYSVAALKES